MLNLIILSNEIKAFYVKQMIDDFSSQINKVTKYLFFKIKLKYFDFFIFS